ncbi:LacI family DNA-binding transcriptional regulator [Lentzea sp. JNUCC 0626]|uniref:LacI family DNA-binding transcriptional regulator n=1 Tax=Lentzea sp. JNUCC 0626 TaxID=3367513 RepID=UPI00374A4295
MTSAATIRDVASRAGVSLGTISNYLNDNKPIAEPTRRRIEAAIAELGFVPNSAVRVMRGARSHVVAFIVPDSANPFFTEVARGIEDVAIQTGHVVVSCNTQGDRAREQHYAKALTEMRVRAAIAVPSGTSDELLRTLRKSGVQVVTLSGVSEDEAFSSVSIDDRLGGALAMDHALDLGHRDIVYLGGPAAQPQIRARVEGCRDSLKRRRIKVSSLRRVDAIGATPALRSAGAAQVLALSPRPTAVVCANDLLALAMESEAIRQGVRVPQDLTIIGYDDIDGAVAAPIPLTTVHQPQYDLGRRAAEIAFSTTDSQPVHEWFTPVLTVRESSAAPASRA